MKWVYFENPDGDFELHCPVCMNFVANEDGTVRACAHLRYSYRLPDMYTEGDNPRALPAKVRKHLLEILRKQPDGDSRVKLADASVEDVVKAIKASAKDQKNLFGIWVTVGEDLEALGGFTSDFLFVFNTGQKAVKGTSFMKFGEDEAKDDDGREC
ncbi:MAG TPA: hypothetical protein VGP72_16365 [Planctomycetota bacterium]|jgi:hypothetical protein